MERTAMLHSSRMVLCVFVLALFVFDPVGWLLAGGGSPPAATSAHAGGRSILSAGPGVDPAGKRGATLCSRARQPWRLERVSDRCVCRIFQSGLLISTRGCRASVMLFPVVVPVVAWQRKWTRQLFCCRLLTGSTVCRSLGRQ